LPPTHLGGPYMRVFDLVDHLWTDIRNDDLSAGRGVSNCLLCAFDGPFLDFVLDAVLGRRSCSCGCLCLGRGAGSGFGVNCSISVLLVPVEVFDKLLDGWDWVVARVVAAGGLLLRRHVVQPWWRVGGRLRRIDPGARCSTKGRNWRARERADRVEMNYSNDLSVRGSKARNPLKLRAGDRLRTTRERWRMTR
jgi:hypothetical protein